MKHTGLEKMIERERKILCALQEEYDGIRGGALHIRYRRGRYFFWEYSDKKQVGITRNKERIYLLARKKYLSCVIEPLRKSLEVLEAAYNALLRIDGDTHTAKICEYYKMLDISRVMHSPKEIEWISRRTSANPYRRENLKYATTQGVMTRSKSERLIGNVLEERGVVYITEPEVMIDGRAYYPDFMILRKDGTTVIWEHCGLMDNSEYLQRTLMKIEKYRSIGYVQTKNLIYTFEEDLEDMGRLYEIIDRFNM